MIQYNQLSAEGKLHIDIEVEDKPYYENINIVGVKVYDEDTYDTEFKPIKEYTQEPSKTLFVELAVPLKNNLLFIVPVIEGYVTEECPCGGDVCNEAYIYCDKDIKKKGLDYLRELGNNCQTPRGFIDFILKATALDLSLQTCNYLEAIKYWKYLKNSTVKVQNKNCGCHG